MIRHQSQRVIVILAIFIVIISSVTTVIAQQSVPSTHIPAVRAEAKRPVSSNSVAQSATELRMPSYTISVNADGDPALHGRKVIITMRTPSRTTISRALSLDANGDASYTFNLPSAPTLAHGVYTVSVAKGPADPSHYASTANYCFAGTNPVTRSITIDRNHRDGVAVFTINATIAWNRNGWCW